ncbi:MAG: type II toxin-antitoxin system VapC family toxin [Actinomycetota bacterium]
MRLLLDTHILLWWLTDDRRTPAESREIIREGKNQVFVSSASAWEIAIKRSLGKLRAPADLKTQIQAARFEVLNVTIDHALGVADLPAHHSDPFDRILVAQALFEGLTVVTQDPKIHRYEVSVLAR